jgi:hypothetical protein
VYLYRAFAVLNVGVSRNTATYRGAWVNKHIPLGKGKEEFLHWYNPTTRVAESVPAPHTDQEAENMLGGIIDSWAFVSEYERLRYEGMGIEQAMIFVGHRFRMWHLRHLPVGEAEGRDPDRTKPYGRADARKVRLLPRRV